MLRQYLSKRGKIFRGVYRTRIRDHREAYAAESWWDEEFFTKGLSDRQTIAPDQDILTAAYHYASVELLLLRHLRNTRFDPGGMRICDLGSGSGHWIQFYLELGASRCLGIDISRKSIEFLEAKCSARSEVSIRHGKAHEVLRDCDEQFDLVNAIGVMFHLVDDSEWEATIRSAARSLVPGGLFVVGGHFGWFGDVNVQFDARNSVNKKLRSSRRWRRTLKHAGFEAARIYRNRAYLFIRDPLPENNLLIARKG